MISISEWDSQYRNSAHLSRWPWSHLVSYFYRHCHPYQGVRVHEIGCGAGANIPLFRSVGADFSACDGSAYMVSLLKREYPDLAHALSVNDFSKDLGISEPVDVIVDRAAVTTNTTRAIEQTLDMVYEALKPGGIFLSVDWYSTDSDDFREGQETEDPYVRTGYTEGPFADLGTIHFADRARIERLFRRFDIVALYKKAESTVWPGKSAMLGTWDVVARRPS